MSLELELIKTVIYYYLYASLAFSITGLMLIGAGCIRLIKSKGAKGKRLVTGGIFCIIVWFSAFFTWGGVVLYEQMLGVCLGFTCPLIPIENYTSGQLIGVLIILFSFFLTFILLLTGVSYLTMRIGKYLLKLTEKKYLNLVIRIILIYPLVFILLLVTLLETLLYGTLFTISLYVNFIQ